MLAAHCSSCRPKAEHAKVSATILELEYFLVEHRMYKKNMTIFDSPRISEDNVLVNLDVEHGAPLCVEWRVVVREGEGGQLADGEPLVLPSQCVVCQVDLLVHHLYLHLKSYHIGN